MTEEQQQPAAGGDDAGEAPEQSGWTDERRPDQPGQPADEDEHGDDLPADEDEQPADDAGDEDEDEDEDERPGNGNAEAAKYRRQRNEARNQADEYGRRLFTELVRATGRLADPTDMPYSAELLDSPDDLAAAIDDLTTAKPHLKARRFANLGQHQRGRPAGQSLGDILRSHA